MEAGMDPGRKGIFFLDRKKSAELIEDSKVVILELVVKD